MKYSAEGLELHLHKIFKEQGHARTPIEMVHCLEVDLFNQYRQTRQGLRMILLIRPGLHKMAKEILDDMTRDERKIRIDLLENDLKEVDNTV